MDNVPEQVDQVLGVLAERFGATGAHLWEVLIRQAYVELYTTMAALVLAGVVCGVSVWLLPVSDKEAERWWGAPVAVASLVSGVWCIVLVLVLVLDAIPGALNPEYFALQQILGAF